MNKRILVASGKKVIDDAVATFENYDVVCSIDDKKDLYDACKNFSPDILLVSEGLWGQEPLIQILLSLIKDLPNMRIVYLVGQVDMRDEAKVNSLGILVMSGVYDIIHEKKITIHMLRNILDNPKSAESVAFFTRKLNSSSPVNNIEFEIPEEKNEEDDDVCKNLYIFSSIKPGTGKSFLSTNVATAIANYGKETQSGHKPKVALIEADLQNLSVGTLLQIEDDKKNLKAVMEKISAITTSQGITGNPEQIEETNAFILSCFKPYCRCKNLEALVGSQLSFAEIENIKPYFYIYLIEAISKEYDVIIVDTNSSISHVTTFALLQMAKDCYYVLNLDFNNIRNNVRYKEVLKEMRIMQKVKYVLNEDIVNEEKDATNGVNIEELIFTAEHLNDSDFKLEARIPMLPKTVFLNRLYEGTPVVLDDKKYTLKAKYELMKVANQIWPIKNFKELEEEVLKTKKKKKLF